MFTLSIFLLEFLVSLGQIFMRDAKNTEIYFLTQSMLNLSFLSD